MTTTVTELGEQQVFALWYQCDACGCDDIVKYFRFCPGCGKLIEEPPTVPKPGRPKGQQAR